MSTYILLGIIFTVASIVIDSGLDIKVKLPNYLPDFVTHQIDKLGHWLKAKLENGTIGTILVFIIAILILMVLAWPIFLFAKLFPGKEEEEEEEEEIKG